MRTSANIKICTALFLTIASLLTSCEIERLPYDSMSSDEIVAEPKASIDALLNGCYAQMKDWSDVMHRCGEYAGDNIMIRGTSTDSFYEFISYSRTPNNGRLQRFWDNSYKVIAQSSNILDMIDEGISEEMDSKLGECYYLRGLMYFYLCRAYGRPYYQNPDQSLGVPIVNGTPEDMNNLELPDRSTVSQTYEQAISDLKKAESLLNNEQDVTRASKEAAQALLSRVYLYMSGTWESPNEEYATLAVEYANRVIESGSFSLLGREAFMLYSTFPPEQNTETIFAVKRVASEYSGWDHYYGIGGMYANIGGMGWGEMYASAQYLALLNETGRNDWREESRRIVDARAAFIDPQYTDEKTEAFRFIKNVYSEGVHVNYNYVQAPVARTGTTVTCIDGDQTYTLTPVDEEQEIYSIDYADGNSYTGVLDYEMRLNRVYPMFYITKCSMEGENSHLHSPVISRLGEIYLNRAEAQAKLSNYTAALEDLNIIRERSLPGAGYVGLNAETASELIEKERQLELAYQAERSYDVFRNGRSLKRRYPGPHNTMEEVLPTDYRVVYYIPQDAINSYPGTLTQNPTN